MATCAFIGLGNMGYPMAGHLVAAGHNVRVFNRTRAKAEGWEQEHSDSGRSESGRSDEHGRVSAVAASTPAEAAANADLVMICVGGDDDVRSVVLGPDGALAALAPGAVIIDHTTASASLAIEINRACANVGVGFVDGPVSGGQVGAVNGTLSVMCGGSPHSFETAEPIMSAYAAVATLVGDAGAGQQTKMVNQILCAGAIQGAAEALAFGQRAGLDMTKVLSAVTKGAAGSWYLSNRGETMIADEFDFGFAIDWLAKDLGIVKAEADRIGATSSLVDLTSRYLREAQDAGDNRMDATAIIRQYER